MIYKQQKYSEVAPSAQNGDTFDHCNLGQLQPHTKIFAELTGLTFIECNLCNCDWPADSVVNGGLRVHISFCKWLTPNANLPDEPEVCPHAIDTDNITIDGQAVMTVYRRENKVVI